MQDYINYKWLPDYVFNKRFDNYIFINFNDFFNHERSVKLISLYCAALKEINELSFSIYEITNTKNQLDFLEEYKLGTNDNSEEIAMKILNSSYNKGTTYYLSIVMIRCLFVTDKNEICIYFERDLDAIVIGCSKVAASKFAKDNGVLNIMNLQEYILMLESYYGRKREYFMDVKEKLLKNYS